MLELDGRLERSGFALDVTLAVESGCLAVAGPSGAGKTTVLRMAAGLTRPDSGKIRCGSVTWFDSARGLDVPPDSRGCGFVFQDYALFPHLTALENVAFGIRGRPRRERRRRAAELLARFGLAGRASARPGALSGGERQRVALARALAPSPAALLLDEPLAALDPQTRAAAARELGDVLRDAGIPAVLVTHDFAQAAQLGARVAVVDAGRVVQRGTPAELAARPASAFVADFVGASVLRGTARPGSEDLTLVELDGGGTLVSTDRAEGRIAASVFPWDVTIEPAGAPGAGSAQNRLAVVVASVTEIGNRVRVGLSTPQPLAAEITLAALRDMRLTPGDRVEARWKATATRLTEL